MLTAVVFRTDDETKPVPAVVRARTSEDVVAPGKRQEETEVCDHVSLRGKEGKKREGARRPSTQGCPLTFCSDMFRRASRRTYCGRCSV